MVRGRDRRGGADDGERKPSTERRAARVMGIACHRLDARL
jgi:hypothetical protein